MAAILACGFAGGLGGGLFSRLLLSASFILPSRLAAYAKHRPVLFAALCGLGVALLGLITDGMVYGTGYEATRLTLEESGVLPWHFGISKLISPTPLYHALADRFLAQPEKVDESGAK